MAASLGGAAPVAAPPPGTGRGAVGRGGRQGPVAGVLGPGGRWPCAQPAQQRRAEFDDGPGPLATGPEAPRPGARSYS